MKHWKSSNNRACLSRRVNILIISLVLLMILMMIKLGFWNKVPIYLSITERNPTYNNNEHKSEINTIHESEKIQTILQTLLKKVESIVKTMEYLSLYQKHMHSRNQKVIAINLNHFTHILYWIMLKQIVAVHSDW